MAITTNTRQKERVQFDFSPDLLQRLDIIKEKTDASTRAEIVRNALKLYEWFVKIDPDSTIEIHKKDGELITRVPAGLIL